MDDIDLPELTPHLVRPTPEEIINSGEADDQPVPDGMPSEGADNSETQGSQSDGIDQTGLKPHPIANMFPRMQGEEFTGLVTSIKEDGLEEHIVKFEGKILDGCNRYAACIEAEVVPDFDEYEGDDPLGFVLRKNLHRRHLTVSQRALVASKLTTMKQGERTDLEPSANLQKVSVAEAAETLNVSPRSVETAKAVLVSGDDELIATVESGEVSVSAAAKQITEPSAAVESLPEGEQQSRKLLKLWGKTGEEGRALFREAIGPEIMASGEEE